MNQDIPISRLRTHCADQSDALGWKLGKVFELDGYLLGLRSNDAEALDSMLQDLPARASASPERRVDRLLSFLKAGPARRRGQQNYHIVYSGCEMLERELRLQDALSKFRQRLKDLVIRYSSTRGYARGSVLTHKTERVVLLGPPEDRHAMTALFMEAGYGVDTEDLVIVDDHGNLFSWWEDTQGPADIVLKLSNQECSPDWQAISPALAAMEIFRHRAPEMVRQPNELLTAFGKLAQRAQCFQARPEKGAIKHLQSLFC